MVFVTIYISKYAIVSLGLNIIYLFLAKYHFITNSCHIKTEILPYIITTINYFKGLIFLCKNLKATLTITVQFTINE